MSVFVIGYSERPLSFSSHLIDTASASFIEIKLPKLALRLTAEDCILSVRLYIDSKHCLGTIFT